MSFLRDKLKLLELCIFCGKKETQKVRVAISTFFGKVEFCRKAKKKKTGKKSRRLKHFAYYQGDLGFYLCVKNIYVIGNNGNPYFQEEYLYKIKQKL